MNMDGDSGPLLRLVCHDNELSEAKDDCYVFFLKQKMTFMVVLVQNKKLNIMGMTMMDMMT